MPGDNSRERDIQNRLNGRGVPSHHSGHPSALIGAVQTRLGTLLTMIMFMLLAFLTASFADFRTELTKLLGELRSATHE